MDDAQVLRRVGGQALDHPPRDLGRDEVVAHQARMSARVLAVEDLPQRLPGRLLDVDEDEQRGLLGRRGRFGLRGRVAHQSFFYLADDRAASRGLRLSFR